WKPGPGSRFAYGPQIRTILRFPEPGDECLELALVNETLTKRHFFRTCDLESLSLFQRPDEFGRLQKAVGRARIEPGKTAAQYLHRQRVVGKISLVHIGNFQLAASGWSEV